MENGIRGGISAMWLYPGPRKQVAQLMGQMMGVEGSFAIYDLRKEGKGKEEKIREWMEEEGKGRVGEGEEKPKHQCVVMESPFHNRIQVDKLSHLGVKIYEHMQTKEVVK